MRKIYCAKKKITALIFFLVIVLLWVNFIGFCPIRKITGVICPGCGMTRAWLAFFKLDICNAFRYHPMFWALPIFIFFALYDFRPFNKDLINILIIAGMLIGMILCYAVRLYLHTELYIVC